MRKRRKKQQIAFYSNRDGNFEIYVMDVDGNNPQRLTINPAIDAGAVVVSQRKENSLSLKSERGL